MGYSAEVNPVMKRRLRAVQADLQTQYDLLPASSRPATLADFAGLTSIRGWRVNSGTSFHASGSAVDVNYRNQPYIVTRSTDGTITTLGGEAAGSSTAIRALRQPVVDVFDRASQMVNATNADVNQRRSGESTGNAYQRFKATSNALAAYLGLAFQTGYDEVLRPPIANIESATEVELEAAIPLTERKDEPTALAAINTFISDPAWQAAHPGFTQTAREIYFRILRDYEHVRIPMVRGNPSTSPADTRNPARGFLQMPERFVVAMADVGQLRWGAADLGAQESGDVHHFDLGSHAGFAPNSTPP